MPTIPETLAHLAAGQPLTEDHAERTFRAVLSGEADAAQIASLLSLLALKGVTPDELTGAARVMREHVTPVPVADDIRDTLVDTCGTGGAPKTFNISTAAAIVAAAAGRDPSLARPVRVAKHGNRSRTGRGSSEVMKQLGINVDASPETQARCLEEAGVCFCFAIHHHPAMKHAAGPRKSLGFPTIFNLLGPLTNPAGAAHQLLGVYDEAKVPLVAETLRRLGAKRAWVVHGLDGLDEITTTDKTLVAEVNEGGGGGGVKRVELDAEKMGIPRATLDDLKETTLEGAADRLRSILDGEPGPARDITTLNAAAAILIAGGAPTLVEALERARAAIDSGAARRTLEDLARISNA